jgi:Tfp pilus assembly protein PilX
LIARVLRRVRDDEAGFAIVLAVALGVLIAIVAVALTALVQSEDSRTRRDQTQDGAYQAAEAGTNAYLSDLTESNAFYTAYMAKGEATRTDSGSVAHANNCTAVDSSGRSTCSDVAWSSGSTWTYPTSKTTDTGWFSIGSGYQYLIQVYPPNQSLTGLAQTITRIDVTGRPNGSANLTQWRTIETMIRPSSLADFQAFAATDLSYGSGATTTGPVFVGENSSGTKANLSHAGTAKANLYAEGTVTVTGTLANGAKKYDSTTTPTALCKLNNCTAVPFSNFSSTFATVAGAAGNGGILLTSTDTGNSALSGQSPAYSVAAWKLVFQSNGTVLVSSCKLYVTTGSSPTTYQDYDGTTPPVCGNQVTKTVPTNGAIYSPVDVLVSGVVKGKVTVATAGNVIWAGNTTYNTNGVDVLGIEATGTIYVAQWAPDSSHNLTIYAAEFALNGPFEQDPNACSASGTLNFYGSTAIYGINGSKVCGSSLSSAIVFSSFFAARNYNYDNNLLFVQPPYWPTLGNAFTILLQRQL